MRMTSMVAGLAVILAACGGEKKTQNQPAAGDSAGTPDQSAPAAAAPAAAGKTHDVSMEFDGKTAKYVPDQLTIGPNDVIKYHNKSGPPHNVSFWEDSIPKGAASHIVVPEPTGTLASKLVVAPDEVIEVKFNDAPKGEYKYYCLPHMAFGMKGKLSVQ
jgi:plastocyanin